MKCVICFLPKGDTNDPGQLLTLRAFVNDARFHASYGVDSRFFAGFKTWLKYRPDFIHFDWITKYYVGRNAAITTLKVLCLLLDLFLVTRICRVRLLWSLHNLQPHECEIPPWLDRAMQRLFARHAVWIRLFSESSKQRACDLLRASPGKFRVLPEASFVGYYPDDVTEEAARLKLDLPPAARVLLWQGSIRPYKGIEELIRCFRNVPEPEWRLLIAGRRYHEKYARSIAGAAAGDDRILVHDRFIPESELQYYYRAADVVVLPYIRVENSGSLLVAMGFARPVIAPALGVIGERLRKQPSLVYPPGQLGPALEQLRTITLSELRRMGAENRNEVTRYHWDDFPRLVAAEWEVSR
jgi:beta-1,4-mannosyltransferase